MNEIITRIFRIDRIDGFTPGFTDFCYHFTHFKCIYIHLHQSYSTRWESYGRRFYLFLQFDNWPESFVATYIHTKKNDSLFCSANQYSQSKCDILCHSEPLSRQKIDFIYKDQRTLTIHNVQVLSQHFYSYSHSTNDLYS